MDEVRLISPEETYPLRLEVLWPHLDRLDQCGIDVDETEGTFHVGALKDGKVVAIGTFLIQRNEQFDAKKQYRLRAMASSPDVRGGNYGKRVIDFALDKLKNEGIDLLWCDARKIALGFYEKMGFEVTGDFYEVRNIGPHKLMYYRINQ
ncbi:MAG: GNAT family N-acetyltransferase [Flavobacteriales bacterium]|nr:GNAT family N-acetyltransferase [Flavobacteriales bacterium]